MHARTGAVPSSACSPAGSRRSGGRGPRAGSSRRSARSSRSSPATCSRRRLADLHDLRVDADVRRAHWRLEIDGLVRAPVSLTYDQLLALPRAEQVSDFHCVTGWRVRNVRWAGVRFRDLLALAGPLPAATAIRFVSAEEPYVDSLTLDQALLPNVLLALRARRAAAVAPARVARTRRDPGDVRLQGRQVADADGARRPAADRLLGRARLRPERVGGEVEWLRLLRRRLPRFARTERAVHWVHATAFLVLLGSGLCLYLPSLAELGRPPSAFKTIHIYTAVAWAVALVAVVARRRPPRAARARRARSTASTPTIARGSAAHGAAGTAERRPEAERDRHRRVRDPVRGHRVLPLVRRARHALPARRTRCSSTTG